MAAAEGAAVSGTRGLERQLSIHIKKLADYRAHPEAFDNLGMLQRAPTPAIRQKIIDSRIRSLGDR